MATHQEIEEETYRRIVLWARERDSITILEATDAFRLTYNGAHIFLRRMQQEGVLGPVDATGRLPVQK